MSHLSPPHAGPAASELRAALADTGRYFHGEGWLRATGGNLSARLRGGRFVITASGHDKGALQPGHFVVCDADCAVVEGVGRASAETPVHAAIYAQNTDAQAILHVHSPHVAVLSRRVGEAHRVEGYEYVKALGFWSEGAVVDVPVVPNHADIPALAEAVAVHAAGEVPGVWVAGHGTYAWGDSVAAARRHVEAFEELARYGVMDRLLDGVR